MSAVHEVPERPPAEPCRGPGEHHPAAPGVTDSPRVMRLAADLGSHGTTPTRESLLADFWTETEAAGTPLIEPVPGDPHHRAVTFLWRGGPTTRRVLLLVNRLIDRSDHTSGLMRQLPGTDVWYFTYRLRSDHRGSYRIAADDSPVVQVDEEHLRSLAAHSVGDPLNPEPIATRWHGPEGSVFALPDAPPQPWRARRPLVERGTVQRRTFTSGALGAEREVWVYLPPGTKGAERPAPDVLLLLDGDMWFGQMQFENVLDNLHADGALGPLAVVAPDAVDNATRMGEFGGRTPYVDFLTSELLPWAVHRWSLSDDPSRTALAGQSLGGTTALFTALAQSRTRVGNVIAQSTSLWWHPDVGPGIPSGFSEGDQWLTRQFTERPVRDVRIRLDTGLHEGVMTEMARRLEERLRARGYSVTHTEFNGGHDYACWSGALADGLVALLGPRSAR
ncbi:enterochelin esterase [Streptomyces sp. WMMB 714]|nr:enterochelin esterase [Streptomyces sp. WMMB 714]